MAVKIRWNIGAFEALRRSPAVKARLAQEVAAVRGRLGDGYASGVEEGATRSRGYVMTETVEAMRDNAENHSLARALGGGGR